MLTFIMTLDEKLDLLRDLVASGIITDDEYDAARESVLQGKPLTHVSTSRKGASESDIPVGDS